MALDENETLKARIRDAIQNNGGASIVSQKTGIPLGTLNKYVAMSSTASFTNAAKIAVAIGVSLEEMAFGRDEAKKEKVIKPSLHNDFDLIIELGKIVRQAYKIAGIQLSGTTEIDEINSLYKELLNTIRDINQTAIVKAVLPEMEKSLAKRLAAAKASPGTGKREAS